MRNREQHSYLRLVVVKLKEHVRVYFWDQVRVTAMAVARAMEELQAPVFTKINGHVQMYRLKVDTYPKLGW